MTKEEEIQRCADLIEYYKSQLQSIETQFSYLQATLIDYMQAKITIEKISETKKDTDILVPIGGGTFAYATAKNTSKILTEVGAGIAIEKNPKDAINVVQKRIETLEQSQKNMSNMSQTIQQQINELSIKAEHLLNETQ
ncbi:MAG: prefoldin subunit alpha [Bacillota bacterium]|jgi:prefoldin alpha subunit